jgi:hypothetical protein
MFIITFIIRETYAQWPVDDNLRITTCSIITWHHNPEDHDPHFHCPEKLEILY